MRAHFECAAAHQDRNTTAVTPTAAMEVGSTELQGHGAVFCPNPKMALWSNHPRVFIDVDTAGEGKCPYCGTVCRLAADAHAAGSH